MVRILKEWEFVERIWTKLRDNGYEVDDADIMISFMTIREQENLLTLDRDFQLIKNVVNLDVVEGLFLRFLPSQK